MSRRGRTKIPIPSFKPPPPVIEASSEARKVSVRSTNDETGMREMAKTKIRLPLNEYCLIKLETALQLYLHHQQQNGDRVSFADFSTIASKIDKNVTLSSKDNKIDDADHQVDNKGDSSDSFGLWKLSTEERLWHDIYCVAVPALYGIGDPNNNENNKNGRKAAAAALVLTRVSFPAATIVGKVAGEGNRLKELRRLIKEAKIQGIYKAKSGRAFDLLLAFRREKTKYDQERRKVKNLAKELEENGSVDANCDGSNNIVSEKKKQSRIDLLLQDPGSTNMNATMIVVKDGKSTIEDRVRARAQERNKNLQQAKAARKDPREERVPIADALFSYASHILRRTRCRRKQHASKTKSSNSGRETIRGLSLSSRFAKTADGNEKMENISPSPSKCILTFQEVVKNALPNRSRKEIARLMLDIVQVLSLSSSKNRSRGSTCNFLKWRDPTSGEINGLPISNNAIVWIETVNFKYIRAVLNRKKVTGGNGGEQQTQRIRESAAPKSTTSSSASLATLTGGKQPTKANNSDTVGKKRPVSDTHSSDKQRRVHSHTKSKRK